VVAKELKLNLPSVGDLFSTQAERDDAKQERVVELPLSEISNFQNHPFKVRLDEEMQEMSESVKKYGILIPALVRPKDGGYEMIAGHRRKMASELAERGTMPCIVRDFSDNEAIIIMVDSNLQREKILPSERAFAYKMRLDAIRRSAGRPSKKNSATPLQNFEGKTSRELIAAKSPDSHEQIRKFICLTKLIPELLEMVDNGEIDEKPQIAMRPAVELSYLSKEQQQFLCEAIDVEDCTPSHVQAAKMRKFSEEGRLNEDVIMSIMQERKPNQIEQFKIPQERISRFFSPGTPAEKIQDTIVKALESYRNQERKKADAR